MHQAILIYSVCAPYFRHHYADLKLMVKVNSSEIIVEQVSSALAFSYFRLAELNLLRDEDYLLGNDRHFQKKVERSVIGNEERTVFCVSSSGKIEKNLGDAIRIVLLCKFEML
uniref:Bm14148 n=1 Tax=Brugia malayi TaxID=6279 RepID=A0A1I9G0L8_BRUMA|nr:Bm14148 [Brugia malayi]